MGATKQIQKTKQKHATTKTEVTQRQSIEIVQTLLHGALSSIAFHRKLLPDVAFRQQLIEHGDRLVYADYASGKLNKKKSTKVHTSIQAMQRGKSKRADMLLTWLETGAFNALKDGRLQAVQLNVHAQPDSREKVIETYTFTVKYDSNGAFGKALAGVQMDSQESVARTVEATTAGLQMLLRELIACCQGLPGLPATRFITMTLFYDGEDYRPPGFIPSTTDDLMFAEAFGWARHSQTFNELPSAFHGTTLRISHLRQPDLLPQLTGSPIPSQLEYSDAISRITEICKSEVAQDAPNASNATPSTVVEDDLPASQSRAKLKEHFPSVHHPTRQPTRTFNESFDTQSSNVPRMKNDLQEMLQPERLTQGDTQTQAPPRPQRPANTPLVTAGPSTVLAGKVLTSSVPSDGKVLLLPEVAVRLESEKPRLHKEAIQLAGRQDMRDEDGHVVLCQCGFQGEDPNMMQCSFCETWQHSYCYGFSSSEDPRMGDDHACYQCLLGAKGAAALSGLQALALKRRVMSYALRNGLRKQTDMAKSLGIPVDVAKRLQRELLEDGFITEASNSHKPGFAKTGRPHFVPVDEGPTYAIMIEQLFDPLVLIKEYYIGMGNLTKPHAVRQQLQAIRSASMPPPATPAARLRGQGTPTTASGLDPRASMTPYTTPSRPAGPITKRARDEEDIFSMPAKRAAVKTPLLDRLKSLQSQYMLKAYGSSPSSVVQ